MPHVKRVVICVPGSEEALMQKGLRSRDVALGGKRVGTCQAQRHGIPKL